MVQLVRLEEWTVINENEHSSYPTEWTNLVYERTLRREAAVTVPGLRYKKSRALSLFASVPRLQPTSESCPFSTGLELDYS